MDTRLINAARSGNYDFVEDWLRAHYHDLEAINSQDDSGATALHFAVKTDDHTLAQMLIDAGANVNLGNVQGITPLMSSVVHNHPRLAVLLISAKANLDQVNDRGETALIMAAKRGNSDIARILVDSGANTDLMDKSGYMAFDYAAMKKDDEIVKILELCQQSENLRIIIRFKDGRTKTLHIPVAELQDQNLNWDDMIGTSVLVPDSLLKPKD